MSAQKPLVFKQSKKIGFCCTFHYTVVVVLNIAIRYVCGEMIIKFSLSNKQTKKAVVKA